MKHLRLLFSLLAIAGCVEKQPRTQPPACPQTQPVKQCVHNIEIVFVTPLKDVISMYRFQFVDGQGKLLQQLHFRDNETEKQFRIQLARVKTTKDNQTIIDNYQDQLEFPPVNIKIRNTK